MSLGLALGKLDFEFLDPRLPGLDLPRHHFEFSDLAPAVLRRRFHRLSQPVPAGDLLELSDQESEQGNEVIGVLQCPVREQLQRGRRFPLGKDVEIHDGRHSGLPGRTFDGIHGRAGESHVAAPRFTGPVHGQRLLGLDHPAHRV